MIPKRNRVALTVVIVCAVMLSPLSMLLSLKPAFAANAVLSFSPTQSVVSFPQPVTVNVTLNNVVNLADWLIGVTFNNNTLAYSSLTIPSDNLMGPSGNWLNFQVFNFPGYVVAHLVLNPGLQVSGSGTLCQISFNTMKSGMSLLNFSGVGVPGGTRILDGNGNPIPFNYVNGNVQVNSAPIANYAWVPLKPNINLAAIFDASISVLGWSSSIPGYAPIVSYTWNFGDGTGNSTTSNSNIQHVYTIVGNYTVNLTVTDSVSRTSSISQTVQVVNRTTLWDLDGDFKTTDLKDIAIPAKAFGSTPGSPRWNPIADITGSTPLVPDGKVDMRDIALIAKHFGQPE